MYWLAFAMTMLVLASASYHDVKSREVSDAHWWALCFTGLAIDFVSSDLPSSCSLPLFVGSVMIAVSILFERIDGAVAIAMMAAASVLMILPVIHGVFEGLVSLTMSLSFVAMYYCGLMRGGADVKALAAISLVFPVYPEHCLVWDPVHPVSLVFNPAFSTVSIALLLSMSTAVSNLLHNVRHGMFAVSYRVMEKRSAEGSFVECIGDLGDGLVKAVPLLPFMVPVTIGFAFTMVLGSPLFVLV